MPPNAPEPPGTPTRRTTTTDDLSFATRLDFLCKDWDLGLDVKKRTTDDYGEPTLDCKCVALLQFSHHKKIFDRVVSKFDKEARVLYQGWVDKPKADRGTIPPVTRRQKRPVNDTERVLLLKCLYKISKEYRDAWQRTSGGTPKSILEKIRESEFDVTPVSTPSIIAPSPRKADGEKRARDESFADIPVNKKTRIPDPTPQRSISDMAPPRGRPPRQDSKPEQSSVRKSSASNSRSANTSFAESEVSEVFSQNGCNSFPATQETEPDDLPEARDAFTTLQDDKYISSHYESSSFEARVGDILEDEMIEDIDLERESSPVEEELSQDLLDFGIDKGSRTTSTAQRPSSQNDRNGPPKERVAEAQFRERLKNIFPTIPRCLSTARLCVIYEITRVFLHADVSLSELDAPITSALEDYDILWKFLRSLPCLQDCSFPERSSREAWNCALDNFEKGSLAVVLGGSLTFRPEEDDAFFRLKLDPLKLELSHRLGRRFGHDRFFEILMPQLSGRHIPTALDILGSRGPPLIIRWLVETSHSLVGWNWKPFMVKDKEKRKQKQLILKKDVDSVDTSFRIFFFAVDGPKFVKKSRLITHPDPRLRPKMSIPVLLDCVRPLNERNEGQPFLKFFNRTTLALSRNSATITLKPEEIRLIEKDITFSLDPNKEDPKNVMNDGCGKISPQLALRITQNLGLSYLPTAFQGRIGEAKGLWVVDRHEKGGGDWIETYPSQRKWERGERNSAEWDDPSHRTFEVLKPSGPLKSADLNLQFLPLLMDRAKDKKLMKWALSGLFEQGLELKVAEIKDAMDDPQSFRKFVRDSNPNLKERLKGGIGYKSGLPAVREERLNIFLDAGFDPKKLMFMKDMAKATFKNRTDELKEKLNITVGRSTYAYMVPDFCGVLEADEVYIDFSSFIDNVSGFSGATLSGDEILVARSPAHFVSDIQKVKAVIKAELVGLKDVIVFSTKGKPSLADKLSGGDFDGDIAWVCWEQSIVDNFESAEVPEACNLVEEGLIKQDKTTYKQLVENVDGREAKVSLFLRKSFEFNMRQNLLGICTSFKERICYTQGSVNTWQSRYLSQLLSNLVDQQKQGYIFDEEDWTQFKKGKLKGIKTRTPLYKTDDLIPNAEHIIDNLKYVANKTVDGALHSFHESFPDPPYWDGDLSAYFYKFADLATRDDVWHKLLEDLKVDINVIKTEWSRKFQRNKSPSKRNPNSGDDEEAIPDFTEFCTNVYERFREIQPHDETHASQSLLLTPGANSELSNWELLKASTAVASFANFKAPFNPYRLYVSTFVWWMAGKQLCHLKAMCGSAAPHSVIQKMYIIQKPDPTIIRRLRSEGMAVSLEDTASIANEADLDAMDDD